MSPESSIAVAVQDACRRRSGRRSGSASARRRGRASRRDQNSSSGRRAASPTRGRPRAAAPGSRSGAPTRPSPSSSAGARSRSRAGRRARSIASAVSSSSSVTQSHSTLASPCGTSSARWPIAKRGSVPIPTSSPSGAHARCDATRAARRASSTAGPRPGTYWRGSSQIGQRSGRPGSNCTPHVTQIGADTPAILSRWSREPRFIAANSVLLPAQAALVALTGAGVPRWLDAASRAAAGR